MTGSNKKELPISAEVKLLVMKIVMIILFLIMLFTFLFGIMKEPDNMMNPAIKEGDLVIYYRLDKDYLAGDVVMVKYDGEISPKRVVAVAGDTVEITDEGLVVNGYVQQEKDIYTETLPYKGKVSYPLKIKEGQVFVLGDNRPYSLDSRNYGPVSTDAIKGQVITVIRRRGI
ncbi:signal peptidase I [Catenisphaera adipataccumulans]|jgi:signal peptidase I|uniref:Signal peptidase I n=1 Tax=Catenisphaera adipataccumulans TaxID=700500 RepID=A0A7W8CZJ4_9FIRM|nr:signal peptidase I [Catenisphaera adipataccumulans]MBB5183227.1 signal peptidase I [Catenisphaera adipataccumulans]